MTPNEDTPDVPTQRSQVTDAEAELRVAEILAEREREDEEAQARRTRTILIVVLVILLLLLCGVGAFLYRLLSPSASGTDTGTGDDDLAGINWVRSIYGFGPDVDQLLANPNDANKCYRPRRRRLGHQPGQRTSGRFPWRRHLRGPCPGEHADRGAVQVAISHRHRPDGVLYTWPIEPTRRSRSWMARPSWRVRMYPG